MGPDKLYDFCGLIPPEGVAEKGKQFICKLLSDAGSVESFSWINGG